MSRFLDVLNGSPLSDGVQWRINGGFGYESNIGGLIQVPDGRCTDFASIPKPIQNVYPVWYRYGPAAVIHDEEYWLQNKTRADADNILREAMLVLGVDEVTVAAIYSGVHLFGQAAWEHNAALKASGYRKMVKPNSGVAPYAGIPY